MSPLNTKLSRPKPSRVKALPAPARTLPLLALAALALFFLLPSARGANTTIVWAPATHPDQYHFTTTAGKQLEFTLTAATSKPGAYVVIEPVSGLPAGASIGTSIDGKLAKATFTWMPAEPGDYSIGFVAKTGAAKAPVRTYLIRVKPRYPYAFKLTDDKVAHWAPLVHKTTVVRVAPNPSARVVSNLDLVTSDMQTTNIVLVLDGLEKTSTDWWYRVRLPILPNNTTGWVKGSDLGDLYEVNTHLYVDTKNLTATLKQDGVTIFTTRVGVGKPTTPTPKGQFYIRGKLTHFGNDFYGPIVFGTSARSASKAPEMRVFGDGFVGVHGTSLPQLIPGRPSHGCIRMLNSAIVQLSQLMKVGTPLTIT
jgi:L,D-transpeptidase catalytic domain